jgi:hypothetical protein
MGIFSDFYDGGVVSLPSCLESRVSTLFTPDYSAKKSEKIPRPLKIEMDELTRDGI